MDKMGKREKMDKMKKEKELISIIDILLGLIKRDCKLPKYKSRIVIVLRDVFNFNDAKDLTEERLSKLKEMLNLVAYHNEDLSRNDLITLVQEIVEMGLKTLPG